jgi:hypothetical protein
MNPESALPWDGPNMRRVRESGNVRDLRAMVVSGPGDTELWEVCVSLEDADIPLEVAGRGPDPDSAAASLMATLEHHFAGVQPVNDEDSGGETGALPL